MHIYGGSYPAGNHNIYTYIYNIYNTYMVRVLCYSLPLSLSLSHHSLSPSLPLSLSAARSRCC